MSGDASARASTGGVLARGSSRHRWADGPGLREKCDACGLLRKSNPFERPIVTYRLPGHLAETSFRALSPQWPLQLFLREETAGTEIWIRWPNIEQCRLARNLSTPTGLWTETPILVPCWGESPPDWRDPWLAHLDRLLKAAAVRTCPRCGARPGCWCAAASTVGVPGLHPQRVREASS